MKLPSSVQWTVDQLFAQMAKIQRDANTQAIKTSDNRDLLTEAKRRVGPLADLSVYLKLKSSVDRADARQRQIEGVYSTLIQKLAALSGRVAQFLKDHGISPRPGVEGLGQMQAIVVVPAIIAAAAVLVASIAWIREANSIQNRTLTAILHINEQVAQGRISPADAKAEIAQLQHEADQAAAHQGKDPFGISDAVHALMPLAMIALGFVVLPPLVKALLQKRQGLRVARQRRLA